MSRDINYYNKKRVLITSWSLADWGGAAINSVELAVYLKSCGAMVTLFSYDIEGPLADYVKNDLSIEVLTDKVERIVTDDKDLSNVKMCIDDYDFIIVTANIIPIPILRQVNNTKLLPKFIFIHMSAMPSYPLDAPLLYQLERKLASAILSISDDVTTRTIHRILGDKDNILEYPNPVPDEFVDLAEREGSLKRVAVISSSHPSDEVMNIKDKLERQSIKVDYIGKYAGKEVKVDASFYDKYDLIVGIGKNVQYSLVSGVPIYVYGKFGGSGYLTKNNLIINKSNNFSGRGFSVKTSDEIVDEIVKRYSKALTFHKMHRSAWIKNYSIGEVIRGVFSYLEEKDANPGSMFEQEDVNWLISIQVLLYQFLEGHRARANLGKQLDKKNLETIALNAEVERLKKAAADEGDNLRVSVRRVIGIVRRRVQGLIDRP